MKFWLMRIFATLKWNTGCKLPNSRKTPISTPAALDAAGVSEKARTVLASEEKRHAPLGAPEPAGCRPNENG